MRLYSAMGKQVARCTVPAQTQLHSSSFTNNALQAGMYLVQVEGQAAVQKMLVE